MANGVYESDRGNTILLRSLEVISIVKVFLTQDSQRLTLLRASGLPHIGNEKEEMLKQSIFKLSLQTFLCLCLAYF